MGRPVVSAVLSLALILAAGVCPAEEQYHVLVVNDDGVDAPGIAALVAVLAEDPAYRVTVVAPAESQSGQGHAVVIRQDIPVKPHPPLSGCPTWSADATPATTVRVALTGVLAGDVPELVLSGINRGENSGRIAWYSGTVGAARESVLIGIPAIAFSLQLDWKDPRPDFAAAARWAKPVVDAVRTHGLPEEIFLNVNIPREPAGICGYRLASMGQEPDAVNRVQLVREEEGVRWYRGVWAPPVATVAGTDERAIREGWVSIVPMGLDQTVYRVFPEIDWLDRVPSPENLAAAAD
jgi:5'-nucleotidase